MKTTLSLLLSLATVALIHAAQPPGSYMPLTISLTVTTETPSVQKPLKNGNIETKNTLLKTKLTTPILITNLMSKGAIPNGPVKNWQIVLRFDEEGDPVGIYATNKLQAIDLSAHIEFAADHDNAILSGKMVMNPNDWDESYLAGTTSYKMPVSIKLTNLLGTQTLITGTWNGAQKYTKSKLGYPLCLNTAFKSEKLIGTTDTTAILEGTISFGKPVIIEAYLSPVDYEDPRFNIDIPSFPGMGATGLATDIIVNPSNWTNGNIWSSDSSIWYSSNSNLTHVTNSITGDTINSNIYASSNNLQISILVSNTLTLNNATFQNNISSNLTIGAVSATATIGARYNDSFHSTSSSSTNGDSTLINLGNFTINSENNSRIITDINTLNPVIGNSTLINIDNSTLTNNSAGNFTLTPTDTTTTGVYYSLVGNFSSSNFLDWPTDFPTTTANWTISNNGGILTLTPANSTTNSSSTSLSATLSTGSLSLETLPPLNLDSFIPNTGNSTLPPAE